MFPVDDDGGQLRAGTSRRRRQLIRPIRRNPTRYSRAF
jgi:hypothetical protein